MAAPKKKVEEPQISLEDAKRAFVPALDARSQHVRNALCRLAAQPPQVLILEGGSVDERVSTALWHSALLNCPASSAQGVPCLACPTCLQIGGNAFTDLFLLDGREGSIRIETVRELRVVIGEAPRGQGHRVIILAEAQALGVEAANALLKSLEEPRAGLCFIMTAPQRERLLPTLVSRGWTLTLPWPQLHAAPSEAIAEWARDLDGFLTTGQGWFARTSVKGAMSADSARQLIIFVQKTLSAVMTDTTARPNSLATHLAPLPCAGTAFVSDVLAQAQASLEATVNPALVMDWMATKIYLAVRRAKTLRG